MRRYLRRGQSNIVDRHLVDGAGKELWVVPRGHAPNGQSTARNIRAIGRDRSGMLRYPVDIEGQDIVLSHAHQIVPGTSSWRGRAVDDIGRVADIDACAPAWRGAGRCRHPQAIL